MKSCQGTYRNKRGIRGIFWGCPAPRFHDDRLHHHDDRLHCPELPSSLYMRTDFMAMKTVVTGKNCAAHG
ncbi:hypothetical protein [uncultured Parabacteroides sp.]|uniref:hypothetical protein n=1 Tax=uncultured Parabacteroides sp. TaxID=512312 RepID=UPI00265AC16E|nr:hypothetical protein [uncultured Parabacteroides sp.]